MFALLPLLVSLASFAVAQQTTFAPGTGIRSLWIPFKTVSGTPLASIASRDETNNVTVYVVSCPTASPACALSPNITLTEGASTVKYESSNSNGVASLACAMTGTTEAVCTQVQNGGGNINRQSTTIGASAILYQAIDVTQTINNTSTMPVTVTVTAKSSTASSSTTSSSTAGVQTMSSGPWAMGGAVGAGLIALAAL
ncbi:hypothetical protein LTR85_009673 [Meristemomyces frigidus]|nr:hypothetical protein LTR85_009673 [Meristemomyces frigidus]